MDDKQIVALLLERSEQALGEVSQKYGDLCHHIAKGIVMTDADAAECVNDAYLALWNTVPPQKPASLRAYLTKLLRSIAYDRSDRQNAAKRNSRLDIALDELADVLPNGAGPEQTLDAMVIRDTLNAYLRTLSKEDRFLFLRRYYYLDTCRRIGRMTGMSESAVSTRLARMRQKLKQLLNKEGIIV